MRSAAQWRVIWLIGGKAGWGGMVGEGGSEEVDGLKRYGGAGHQVSEGKVSSSFSCFFAFIPFGISLALRP